MGRCGGLGALVSWMAGAGSLGCVAAALRHSVAVRGRRRLCACAPVWHTLGAGLVLLSGVLYVLYDVLLLLLCWRCVCAWACAVARWLRGINHRRATTGRRGCVLSGVGTLADGGTQSVSDRSLWGVGSIGVVDGGRRVVGLCRCGAAS